MGARGNRDGAGVLGSIYVLHIDPPYMHARHYTGWTIDPTPERRVAEHLAAGSAASPLIRAAIRAGSTVSLAHVITGVDRHYERALKTRRDTCKWCPCCGRNERPLPGTPERKD